MVMPLVEQRQKHEHIEAMGETAPFGSTDPAARRDGQIGIRADASSRRVTGGPGPAKYAAPQVPATCADRALQRRLLAQPHRVLADLDYVRWWHRSTARDKDGFSYGAWLRHLTSDPLSALGNQPIYASVLASRLGVRPIDTLAELQLSASWINRRSCAAARQQADIVICDVMQRAMPGFRDSVDVAFIGYDGLFAELVFLQRLLDAGVRSLRVHLIGRGKCQAPGRAPVCEEGRPADLAPPSCESLEQIKMWLAKSCCEFDLRTHDNEEAFINGCQKRGQRPVDAVVSLGIGPAPHQIDAIKWQGAMLSAYAGQPHCLMAMVYVTDTYPGLLNINQRQAEMTPSWDKFQTVSWRLGPAASASVQPPKEILYNMAVDLFFSRVAHHKIIAGMPIG